jgi:hypothetical protein
MSFDVYSSVVIEFVVDLLFTPYLYTFSESNEITCPGIDLLSLRES